MRQGPNGVWLPDGETYLDRDIEISPRFAGMGTMQFKKFAAAFRYITSWRNALDVGANVGLWTRVMARCFERVIAFEPNPACHEAFAENIKTAGFPPNVIIFRDFALGDANAKIGMTTHGGPSVGHSRIANNGDIIVQMFKLDDVLPAICDGPIDMIKIDVEGFEAKVVKGGEATIRKWRPLIIVEQKPNNAEFHGLKQYEALDLLKSWGAEYLLDMGGDCIVRWKKRPSLDNKDKYAV